MATKKTVSTLQKRRRVRELEAKRDKLLEMAKKVKSDLVNTRALLKHTRKEG